MTGPGQPRPATIGKVTPAQNGGAMVNFGDSDGISNPRLTNVILWGNTASTGNQLYNVAAAPALNYTLIQSDTNDIVNDGGSVTTVDHILTADPLFVDADGDDLQLLPGSPAIDTGTAIGAPAFDIRNLSRPVNGGIDRGAYEMRGFNLVISGGNNQQAEINTAFATPLQVTVSSAAGGLATVSVTANSLGGTYPVTATTTGASGPAIFSLTNTKDSGVNVYLPLIVK